MTQKHAVLVVGTGRSGTSAMTGVLQILGTCLGDRLTEGDSHNTRGYFENADLVDLNKALLSAAGILWYVTPIANVQPLLPTPEICQALRNCLQTVFHGSSPLAIKDPRLCALLDPYVTALASMEYEVHCLHMSRHHVEVAQSMEAATGVEAAAFLPMVQHYAELLETALQRVAVDYIHCTFSDLLTNPQSAIERIVKHLPFLSCSNERLCKSLSFIDKSLRHHAVEG